MSFGVSKFMRKLCFARRKLRGKLFSNYVRIGGEFKERVCAASFPLKLESLKKKPKGKIPCKKELVGKLGTRGAC